MSLNIAKFGGTSVANFAAIQRCAQIVLNNPATRVVVVSAAAGVTNILVKLANDPLTESQKLAELEKIKTIEYGILHDLKMASNVENKLNSLLTQLEELALHEELLHQPKLKDELLSMGERMSSLLVAEVIQELGGNGYNFDARTVVKTDDQFGQGTPQIKAIREKAQNLMLPEVATKILVTQGFVGSNNDGATTTLGRGGSDFTAALLAEALDAQTCEIWTDVNGVYTTDPRITDQAKPLAELSFDEAAEMATFGAKVLHPATMEPAVRKNIRVFVGSSKTPELGGTWIVKTCKHEPAYRAITRRKDQVMVTLTTPKMMYAQGFLGKVFGIIAKHKLSVDLVTTSEISVSMTIDNPPNSVIAQVNKKVLDELREICEVSLEENLDLITVVGNNMQGAPGIASKIFAAINDIQLRMICFGANPHNLSFLVGQSESAAAVTSLHHLLFEAK